MLDPVAEEEATEFEVGQPISPELVAERRQDGGMNLRSVLDGTTLSFTESEWSAFCSGVKQGEFGLFLG